MLPPIRCVTSVRHTELFDVILRNMSDKILKFEDTCKNHYQEKCYQCSWRSLTHHSKIK